MQVLDLGEHNLGLPDGFTSGKAWQNYPIKNTNLNIRLCFCRQDQWAVKVDVQQVDALARYCNILDNFGGWHCIGWQEINGQDVRSL